MKKWWSEICGSWYYSLCLLWVLIIAYQWIQYADGIWYSETTMFVLGTMIAVAVIDIILPFNAWYRLLIKLVAVIAVVYYAMHTHGLFTWSLSQSLSDNMEEFISTLRTYIWFIVAAWMLLEVSARIGTSRRAIIMFVGTNIVALAILDSFTKTALWEEVAWVVFAGMGWLVSNHFRYFQERFPRGWKHLRRYPLKIMFNIAVIFSIILLAGINMPEVQPTLKDPYTAWKNWHGESVITVNGSNGMDGQGASSGYSREDSNLGGGFNFDYTPVMSVSTTSRSYWRGETRLAYSGKGWIDRSSSSWRDLEPIQADEKLSMDEEPSTIETRTVKQQVKMLSDKGTNYPVLFGAYTISRIESVNGKNDTDQLDWRSNSGEVHWSQTRQNRNFPESYSLISSVPVVPVAELEKKTYSELYDGKSLEPYLQMPTDFPQRVKNLAREVTASATTPYRKIELLQSYLKNNYTYTNNPDLSRKKSSDFVDSFLFEIKEGYCDYYSTAMVMMARSLDIPARWVKGYAPGQANGYVTSDYFPEGATEYMVTNADAHSWAEIYFAGYGWIPIEATPGFDMPLLTEAVQAPAQTEQTPQPEEQQQEPEQEQAETPVQATENGAPPAVIWTASLLVAAWVVFIAFRYRRKLHAAYVRMRYGEAHTPQQKMMVEAKRWLAWMKRHGLNRESHETLRESVDRWQELKPELRPALGPLLQLFERAKYSPNVVTEEEYVTMKQYVQDLRKLWRNTSTK
ncbi:transglutaminaseTgpA domain-containing protein [Paenibacillus hunanensis]|uniref:DUF4129 domain-containing transglutaminase family protein n=1 Tax=Paenibacillus hunanensis TaxID=539262 RepID=UPI002A69AB17|nr:transglutaminase domain-containing protein [Paenibacillus hunanensis]WPP42749.1 transglutaminaseTgpA domain-containing protein [Paenibacillus hunanensis]